MGRWAPAGALEQLVVSPPASLAASYRRCQALNRAYGTTYYWSTRLLPKEKRHHVHALYGFCRYADDIVDDLGPVPVAEREAALAELGRRFFADLESGGSDHEVLQAVVHTVRTFGIEPGCFRRFLRSMALDLSVASYESFEDLAGYMDGSAAVIGEMMLPILEPSAPAARAPARDLGTAFQLTNFLRDVGEDLGRGRVYLPQEDIRRFGAGPALAERRVTPEWEDLMAFEIARTRSYYASADRGLAFLPPASVGCIAGARALYSNILDRIEANGYDVFSRRVRVPLAAKLAVAARASRAGRTGDRRRRSGPVATGLGRPSGRG